MDGPGILSQLFAPIPAINGKVPRYKPDPANPIGLLQYLKYLRGRSGGQGGGNPGGGGNGGGGTPGGGNTGWQYPGLLNAPYTTTNWFGKQQ